MSDKWGLINAQTPNLRDYVRFAHCLAHVRGKFIHDLERRDTIHLLFIMSEFKSQVHHVVVLFLMNMLPHLCEDLNGLVSDDLIVLIKQLVQ